MISPAVKPLPFDSLGGSSIFVEDSGLIIVVVSSTLRSAGLSCFSSSVVEESSVIILFGSIP